MDTTSWTPVLLAQDDYGDGGAGFVGLLFGGMCSFVWLAIIVVVIAGMWKTFEKAGQPGWAAIVPFYNTVVLAQIGGREWWFGLLPLVPCIGIVFVFLICIDVAKKFGKDTLYGVGLALLGMIFFPILGFGDAKYQGSGPSN